MKTIPLTRGQVTLVDDEDYDRLSDISWWAHWNRDTKSYYARGWIDGKNVYMHRVILGASTKDKVDHANHDTLDNQRCNIRVCNSRNNNCNARRYKNNSSGYKGVSFRKTHKLWVARIQVKGKSIHIGLYRSALEAAKAYDAAAIQHHGKFAWLNNAK